jgi:hypothetical protein
MLWTSRRVTRLAVHRLATVTVCLLVAASAFAQDKPPVGTSGGMTAEEKAMMDAMVKAATPGANHQLLASVAGDWTFKSRMWMNPSAPPSESAGTVSYTTLFGGRYVEGLYRGEMMGMPFEGRGLMGYDNLAGQFQSTWVDNMGTTIMLMTGQYDAAAKTLTYKGEMCDVVDPAKKVPVRQVVRLVSPDSHVMEWYETRNGKETKMMEISYARSK